jgi:hypothetical protein
VRLSDLSRNFKWLLSLIFFLSFFSKIFSTPYVKYNTQVRNCYQSIINLKIDKAKEELAVLRKSQPENLAIIHLENYIDFFVLFITESKAEYSIRLPNKSSRIDKLEDIKIVDPYIDFIKAEILLQWSLIHLKFDDKLKAGNDIYTAYKFLENNKAKYPTFIENNKSLSVIHVLAESLPKWVRSIVGIKGSLQLGGKEIEDLAAYAYNDESYFFREEVVTIYSYILFYQLNQKSKAIKQLELFNIDHTTSPLMTFLKASMQLKFGNNEKSLAILNDLKKDPSQLPFYYLEFMKGKCLLYKQDPTANIYLKIFVNNFNGRHFIKEAYQKLAWYELSMNNNLGGYKKFMQQCSLKGYNLTDEDKQAQKEAKAITLPNSLLLKSRILYDGGYYVHAQNVLIKNEYALESNPNTNLEYNYRMGRILQALKNFPEAISFLKLAASNKNDEDYLVASAALQLGSIYEEIKQYKSAKYYYQKCLDCNPSEYKNSLHQKAKSGLLRVPK